jgi:hypothetical protein
MYESPFHDSITHDFLLLVTKVSLISQLPFFLFGKLVRMSINPSLAIRVGQDCADDAGTRIPFFFQM